MKTTHTQSNNILVGVLMMSALILGMLLIFVGPRTAEANMLTQSGNVIMITQGGGNGGDETLTIIDAGAQKMVTYAFNGQKNRFNMVAGSSLKAANPAP